MSTVVLVPSPLRAVRAARRLCDVEGGLLFGAEVTTPAAITPLLLAAAGEARPVLTPLAERLLALEAGEGAAQFVGLTPSNGAARSLAAAIAELRRGEVTGSEVRAAAHALGGRAGERLSCVAEVLSAYEERLASLGALDESAARRAAALAASAVATGPFARVELLVLDGFHALSPAILALVAGLARRADRTVARVPYYPDRPDLCGPAEPLLSALEALHDPASRREVTLALPSLDAPHHAPRLARALRAPSSIASSDDGGLVLAAVGAGESGEADAAAAIAERFLDGGFAPDDVVVIAPSPAGAAPRLARAFAARGLPFAGGRGEPLRDAGPVRAALAALRAAVEPGRAALEAVAASPWFRLTAVPSRLGHWLDRAGALDGRGDPEEALRRRGAALRSPAAAAERSRLLRAADALAEIRTALRPLAADARPREHATRLRAFLDRAGARRRAARAGSDLGRRELAALGQLEDAADDLVRALGMLGRGEEALAARRWAALLETAVDRSDRPPPEPAAGAVELWPVAEAAGLSARAAVVVGCAHGAFPARPRVEPLLRETERVALNRAVGRAAVATGGARRAEAQYLAFCALAAGREALALTWPGDGPEGPGAGPSSLAAEFLAAAGMPLPAAPDPAPALSASRTVAEALRAAAREGRAGQAGAAVEAIAAASPRIAARAASALARGALEEERRAAILARRASPAAGAIPSALSRLLGDALPSEWTPGQLETLARCPYRFFATGALRLEDPATAELEIDPRDEGSVAHGVLEAFLGRRRARGALPLVGAPGEREELRAVAGELFRRFEEEGRVGDPAVWEARRGAILARLERVVGAEARLSDGAVPELLEHRFGGASGAPPVTFGDGQDEVRVRGRIDRVDASPDRLTVIDYKDARSPAPFRDRLAREAVGETSFQLPIYMLAAAQALPGRSRIEATYLLLRSAERLEPLAAGPGDPLFALDVASRATARADGVRPLADAALDLVRAARGGALPIASRDCSGCPFGALCRAQSLAEGAA